MSDNENLHERVETNFRLSAIYTRQMGERLDRRVDGLGARMDRVSQATGQVAEGLGKLAKDMGRISKSLDTLATDTKAFGTEIRTDFNALADRQEQTIDAIRQLGGSSIDVNQELADLKRRVTHLENKAS